ncbi:unnamed protein product [marine sediment metagenome]|uniref:Uncharacterized protein n=1 Tax=marine sediment metagenome TaxID=412755 RepID=X1MUE8_9ZZZZ
MKQIFALLLMLGLLVAPVVVGAVAVCGNGTYAGCTECASEELCVVETPCWWEDCTYAEQEPCEAAGCTWNIDTCEGAYCNSQGMAKILGVDIAEIGSKASALSVDLMTLIVLVVGVPLAFMMIKRVIGLMPKK